MALDGVFLVLSVPLCGYKPNQSFEQKETKATKRTTIMEGLLCSLGYLLFKKNEPLI
jgi:hypothetical protein